MTEDRTGSVDAGGREQGAGAGDWGSADPRSLTPDPSHGSALDRVFIRDLAVRCIIGIDEYERQEKQDVLVQITMHVDLRRAGRTDALEDTIDYRALKKRILHRAGESQFHLVEALAQCIADECLRDERVERVEVAVEKPGALRFARTVGVAIVRNRGGIGNKAR